METGAAAFCGASTLSLEQSLCWPVSMRVYRRESVFATLAIVAGNTTAFCNSPRGPDLPASRGSLAVAVTSIHETNYVVVDPNGDIYWSEDLGYRLLVLRGGVAGSTPLRVAGTGAPGIDEGGSVPAGAVALETDLATPGYIVLDPRGSPVFLDGYLPGRILHLNLTSGALTVIAALQLLPADPGGASFPPVVDGTLATATASALAGLTFIDGGEALLTADTAADSSWSVVRRIDLVRGTVSRVAGTFPGTGGVAVDGHPLLETMFNYISAVAVWPGGSIAVADTGTSLIRVGLSSNASSVSYTWRRKLVSLCRSCESALPSPAAGILSRRLFVPVRAALAVH